VGSLADRVLGALFNEELGAVLQVRKQDRAEVMRVLREGGLSAQSQVIGHPNATGDVRVIVDGKPVLAEKRIDLHRAWSEVTHHIQRLRDNPQCADQEYERILDEGDPGLNAKLTFDPARDSAAPFIATGARPSIAVLREQGVNGQMEMAASFDRAGFTAVDVHMTDILSGRVTLAAFKAFAACGGFSYGDVLGAGEGWAKSILFNARARDEFEAFFKRSDTFALGACNGCQMMSNLKDIIPGAANWPHFERNASEQYEARVALVEIQKSPSILFAGMEGSRIPIATAHGEGRAVFASAAAADGCRYLVAARFVTQPRQGHRGVSVQPERLAPGRDGAHHARRALHHPHAPSRTRLPLGAPVVAARGVGRGFALDAHLPQRARLGGLTGIALGTRGPRLAQREVGNAPGERHVVPLDGAGNHLAQDTVDRDAIVERLG
jgi:phosphoribosylformylglycinamidine synthase